MDTNRYLIIIAGGTASGKTTLVNSVVKMINPEKCTVISQDWYYRDHPNVTKSELDRLNYDHPQAFENDLLVHHIKMLLAGEHVHTPRYDFKTHRRQSETVLTHPTQVIILEGILALTVPLLELACFKIFIETHDDLRFIRRADRDMQERGRSYEQIRAQWLETVQPMYLQYCVPSKRFADITVIGGKNRMVHLMLKKFFGELAKNGSPISAG